MTATTIRTDVDLDSIPLPPDAVSAEFPWEHPDSTGLPQPNRYFNGTSRVIEVGSQQRLGSDMPRRTVKVEILGCQWADGTVQRAISVHGLYWEDPLSFVEAMDIAAALTAAVREATMVDHPDHPGVPTGTQPVLTIKVPPYAATEVAEVDGEVTR